MSRSLGTVLQSVEGSDTGYLGSQETTWRQACRFRVLRCAWGRRSLELVPHFLCPHSGDCWESRPAASHQPLIALLAKEIGDMRLQDITLVLTINGWALEQGSSSPQMELPLSHDPKLSRTKVSVSGRSLGAGRSPKHLILSSMLCAYSSKSRVCCP